MDCHIGNIFYHFLNVNLELLYSSCENVWNRLVSLKIINEELLELYVFLHIKIFDYNRTVHKLCIKYAFGIHIYHKMLLVNVFCVLYLQLFLQRILVVKIATLQYLGLWRYLNLILFIISVWSFLMEEHSTLYHGQNRETLIEHMAGIVVRNHV